jgi:cytochrome c oxidase subunit 2
MDTTGTLFLPPANSTIAPEVDALFQFILVTSIIFFIIVVFGTAYFIYKYRKKGKNEFTADISENRTLEIVWTVIPTILVFIIFFWGFRTYLKMHVPPAESIEIKATGQKWFWQFDYENGASSTNDLVVPVGKPVQLLLSSQDVIHSFYVPNFRIKMDVLPNRYTITWFEASHEGEYDLFCAEFCGTGHSKMIGKVKVISEREYKEWLDSSSNVGEGLSLEEYGAQLYQSKACVTCHSIDGSAGTGPTFSGLLGRTENFSDGTSIAADENYIRESILNPQAKIVEGFQPVMPTYQGILKDREIDALITYIKSLSQ